MIENLQLLIGTIDEALDTKRKRHLVGGILLSVSLLFGGLALTSFTLKEEKDDKRKSVQKDDR